MNPHASRRHPLKMVCLPVPPLPLLQKLSIVNSSDWPLGYWPAGGAGALGGVALGAAGGAAGEAAGGADGGTAGSAVIDSTFTCGSIPATPGGAFVTVDTVALGAGVPVAVGSGVTGTAGAAVTGSSLNTESPPPGESLPIRTRETEVITKTTAITMVALERNVAVPRGPNAA